MEKFEVVIIGGGIAGLATAEVFARSGIKTLLLEKNLTLCSETSGLHHEWFHFGSLYSIFPGNQSLYLIKNIEYLLEYYQSFEGMNLRIGEGGNLLTINELKGWIRTDKIQYVIPNVYNRDFELLKTDSIKDFLYKIKMKFLWEIAVNRFIARHHRFFKCDWKNSLASDYVFGGFNWFHDLLSRNMLDEYISRFQNDEISLDFSTHGIMQSYDSPMNAYYIVSDLTKSFLSNGGRILLGVDFTNYQRVNSDTLLVKCLNAEEVQTKKLILASGKYLQTHSNGQLRVETVLSPLLVAYPKVCTINFVRLTPFIGHTINHLVHTVSGVEYSLIGGGYFVSQNEGRTATFNAEKYLLENAKLYFPALKNSLLTQVYSGQKTEVVPSLFSQSRNYLYKIQEVDNGVTAILPGKWSLAFSLAINTFRKIMGRFPGKRFHYDNSLNVDGYVSLTKHKQMVKDFYETNKNQF